MRRLLLLITLFAILASAGDALARRRSRNDVSRERQRNEQQIARARRQLETNTAEVGRQLNRLGLLEATISLRGDTIARLERQITVLDSQITAMSDSIDLLNRRAGALRANYGSTLRALRSRRQGMSDLAFIFSARSFSQAWRRLRYLREVARATTRRAAQVREASRRVTAARLSLDSMMTRLQSSMAVLQRSQATLTAERASAAALVTSLRKEGRALNTEIERRRRQSQALERELQQIIEREAEEARRREAEERRRREAEERQRREAEERQRREAEERQRREAQNRRTTAPATAPATTTPSQPAAQQPVAPAAPATTRPAAPATTTRPASTSTFESEAAADRRITGSFRSNKGRLPFPVSGRYTIVSNFGTNTHPGLSKVKIDNLGIDIEVPAGSSARSVFEGKVTSIFRLDGFHNVVIVRHGEYLTVYAGLSDLRVRKGDNVATGQTLGTIYSDPDDGNRTTLHFEIRLEKQKLNPVEWVK